DFTPTRVADRENKTVIKAYMAHHQGMTIAALANTVLDKVIARYFHAAPMVQAAELLLQERAPRLVPKEAPRATLIKVRPDDDDVELSAGRRIVSPSGPTPDSHVVGNGRLNVLTTAAGSGVIRWKGLAVTRWQADPTLDNLGSYFYVRDKQSGAMWSVGLQPAGQAPTSYEAAFAEDRVQISRTDGTLKTTLDIIVSPEDDVTCRRIAITNTGKKPRTLDLTNYDELVLAALDSDAAHPAFSKLFVETAFDAASRTLYATRRRRGPNDRTITVAAFVTSDGAPGEMEFETDRLKFIGRGRSLASPLAVIGAQPLSNSIGTVLDPIFAVRQRLTVAPGQTVRVCYWLAIAETRAQLEPLIEKYASPPAFARMATLAWTQGLVELRHVGIDADQAMLFQQLASAVLHGSPVLRASERVMKAGALGYQQLWPLGVSGDLPIVLVRIDEIADIGLVRQMLHAFEYWRSKGIEIDLVILNDHAASYQQELQVALEALCQTISSRHRLVRDNSKGSVYLLRSDLAAPETLATLPAAARAVLVASRGALSEQLIKLSSPSKNAKPPPVRHAPRDVSFTLTTPADLEFFNGLGGFRNDGHEYVVLLDGGQTTPAPWINVIANPTFGFQVSAEGAGYTFAVNSRERQLTPWSNDPVINRPGEVIYVRDEDTGEIWGPTASPIRDHAAPYHIAHGQGYTRFEHTSRGIALVLEQFVAIDDPVKISRLTVRNVSGRPRRLSVTSYAEWVLGSNRRASGPQVTTEFDSTTGAIYARNPWSHFFPGRVAFSVLSRPLSQWTADRHDFIGANGTVDNPAALAVGRTMTPSAGSGRDPCAALQTRLDLDATGEAELHIVLGDAEDRSAAERLVRHYKGANAEAQLKSAIRHWDGLLDTLTIETPDRALDLLVNRWLPYQSLACRMWARSGLYQAGGAFGFRDQLQDAMSLAAIAPDLTRQHILTAAARQFPEGDVQHWWLAPSGHGIRTRIADSCLWLPYVTAHYVRTSDDVGILDAQVPFIVGPTLEPHEHENYFLPGISDETATIYEHGARAIDRSLTTGQHGLALFGGGDWNDGMNRVGIEGKGESVWLSWFLIACIRAFAPHADSRGDSDRALRWRRHADALAASLDREAWDGAWYRRGYFDDGTPLGSALSPECRIDAIAQSWSVLAGTTISARSRQAMASVKDHLIDDDAKLALLFSPPFDSAPVDPGYIKGYPPGIRENGGQYTHAAAWSAIALAEMGDGDAAGALLAMLNPITLTATRSDARRYKLEPYVIAADVYAIGAHRGRGGWSWYTGSAGWLYRAAVEHLLGVRKIGQTLTIRPTIPSTWPQFSVTYRYEGSTYAIRVKNAGAVNRGIASARMDGVALAPDSDGQVVIPLAASTSGTVHTIEIDMEVATRAGRASATKAGAEVT
ncbi:MAG: GH36-type glycosyl hydrolase domain-containing protein, partial [Hyphomicrobium sp.]